jgi:hypothetical protein
MLEDRETVQKECFCHSERSEESQSQYFEIFLVTWLTTMAYFWAASLSLCLNVPNNFQIPIFPTFPAPLFPD